MPLNDVLLSPGEHLDPDSVLHTAIEAAEIRSAIAQLTPEQQLVIALKFIEGYKNTEIAQMLNKKEGAIRALQYRALRSLQGILEAREEKELEFTLAYFDAVPS